MPHIDSFKFFYIIQDKHHYRKETIVRVFNEVWAENPPSRRARGDCKQAQVLESTDSRTFHHFSGFQRSSTGCICRPSRAACMVSPMREKSATRELGFFSGSSWPKGTKE